MKMLSAAQILTTLALAAGALTVPCTAQSQASPSAAEDPALVGTWHATLRVPSGGEMNFYLDLRPDGTARQVLLQHGGPQNGLELQRWGHWTSEHRDGNEYALHVSYDGFAPHTICAPAGDCYPMKRSPGMEQVVEVQANSFRTSRGLVATRAAMPDRLAVRLPDKVNRPVAPSLAFWSAPTAGTSAAPTAVPTCDDAQQARMCTSNGGSLSRDSGCAVCSKQ